jgi:hypothetical protein
MSIVPKEKCNPTLFFFPDKPLLLLSTKKKNLEKSESKTLCLAIVASLSKLKGYLSQIVASNWN